MNSKRTSTNVKLYEIINAKNNDKDEEQAILTQEKIAKNRLRRASLYGGGARTKIPKIKKQKKIAASPFTINGGDLAEEHQPKQFQTSIPPGAHEDLFRAVTNMTQKSYNDPDRIFINSSSMLDNYHTISQPPWYFGNNNKIKPSDSNIMISAARYGYRGSKDLSQYTTQPYEIPSRTIHENTPKFLANSTSDFVNEWVPPIVAAKSQTINGLETPKVWPENTEYVTGYPKKKLARSWSYKKETTVAEQERPRSPETLKKIMNKISGQTGELIKLSRLESKNSLFSLPRTSQSQFQTSWRQKVNDLANSSLKYSMKKIKPSYEPHTLIDPSDRLRYSGTTALIVHTQTTDELKFRLRMEKSKFKSKTPFAQKWHHVIVHFKNIQKQLRRGEKMDYVIMEIGKALQNAAISSGSETSMNRVDFIQTMSKIFFFESVPTKQLGVLFTLFDPMKRDTMRFVELLSLFTVLDKPEDLPYDKFVSLWRVYEKFGQDRNTFDIILEILSCCAYSVPDLSLIEDYFKIEFRQQAYALSIKDNNSIDADLGMEGLQIDDSPTNPSASNSHASSRVQSRENTRPNSRQGLEKTGSSRELIKKTMSVKPQYSICEHYLNELTIIKVLKLCSNLVTAFDSQLSQRLIQCYAKDDRYKEPEPDPIPVEELDFTWILKKSAPKKEKFTL